MQFPTEYTTDFPTARKCQLGEPKPGLWASEVTGRPIPEWAHTFAGKVESTVDAKESLCHHSSVNGVAPPNPPPTAYMQVSRRSDNPSGHLCEPERSVAITVSPRICRRSPFS